MKIGVFFGNYGPYHIARVASFQEECSKLGWDAFGIELTRDGIAYEWQTEINASTISIISLLGNSKLRLTSTVTIIKELRRVLQQIEPDALAIAGYSRPSMLAAFLWSQWYRIPVILFSASKEDDAPRTKINEYIKSLIVRHFSAALVGGQPQKRYLQKLGMEKSSIFTGYNVVENSAYTPKSLEQVSAPIKGSFFLAINRFIQKKNLPFLISAYANYRANTDSVPWDLVLCGDGDLRTSVEQQITELGLSSNVHLPGFLQQQELLPYFWHAKCFIHASTQEQWGLVVNEAMAAGLPVIVSRACGCYEDLIIEGKTGYGFDPTNLDELSQLMVDISSSEEKRAAMGKAALNHIQKFSPNRFAEGLRQAIEYGLAQRHSK